MSTLESRIAFANAAADAARLAANAAADAARAAIDGFYTDRDATAAAYTAASAACHEALLVARVAARAAK